MKTTCPRETDYRTHQAEIAEEHRKLQSRIVDLFGQRVWFMTEAALSVCVSCLLKDIANPLALIFVDGPSTEKTTVLDFFDGLPYCHRVDKFTPASFLTQSVNVKKKDLEGIDLLAQLPYKTLLIPEMGPLFSQPKEILAASYGVLARILDGSGFSNAGAVHGRRALTGDYMFGMLGASTPIDQTAWHAMGKLGSRLLFLNAPARLSRSDRRQRARAIIDGRIDYRQKRQSAKEAVKNFFATFFKAHEPNPYLPPPDAPKGLDSKEALLDHCGYLPRSVAWDTPSKNDKRSVDVIVLLAEFVTTARQDTRIWRDTGPDGVDNVLSTEAISEGVDRFTAVINNLARSHALLSGRRWIAPEDLPLVTTVSMSSIPDDRRKALELLIGHARQSGDRSAGEISTQELARYAGVSDKTALNLMRKLEKLNLGSVVAGTGRIGAAFRLHPDYEWLFENSFWKHYRAWETTNSRQYSE